MADQGRPTRVATGGRADGAPVYHPDERACFWVDRPRGHLYRYDLETDGAARIHDHGGPVGGLTIERDGGLVLFATDGLVRFSPVDRTTAVVRRLPDGDEAGDRFTGAVADPAGRVFAGATGPTVATASTLDTDPGSATETGPAPARAGSDAAGTGPDAATGIDGDADGAPESARGSIHRFDPAADADVPTPHPAVSGMATPAGLALGTDRGRLYVAAAGADRIDRLAYDRDSGRLTDRRQFVAVGTPGGLAVDAAGHVWVARMDRGRIERYAPGGRRTAAVALPTDRVTGIALAGAEYRTVLVTTAGDGLYRLRLAPDRGAAGVALFRSALA